MDTSGHSGNNKKNTVSSERPVDIKDWNKDHVKKWMQEIKVDEEDAEILYKQRINGDSLLLLEETDLKAEGLSLNARKLIIQNIGLLKKQPPCSKPYPFNRSTGAQRYRENSILDVTETGPIDLIQPCHEFKGFTKTPEEKRMSKYTYEVIRFAAACMNSRTNGTIHFGVADKPHGQILGVSVQNTDDFDKKQSHAIEKHFKLERSVKIAKRCIKPPRFVEVLKADMTSAGKYVIEVDIEPSSTVCEEFHFNTYNVELNEDKKKKRGDKSFFIRGGCRTDNLIGADSSEEYEKYIDIVNMQRLSQLRKDAEEKHLSVVKNSVQGSKLCEIITGGTQSLDRSHFTSYIVVANKSHPGQLENLEFLLHMSLVAVLDFDPESAKSGLNKMLGEKKMSNAHLPAQYKITGAVEDIANRLKLTKNTSWVFCNGGIHGETPSDADHWLTEKGSSVRDVVSFLCRKDVLPRKKLLTIFLLLNPVSDAKDPLLETFSMFLQELNGENQILCISDSETTYTFWKDLIKGRYGVNISRCIYELSFAEVNGTVLSLWSENRKSKRFLPCGGGSKVELSKKTEESLDMLRVLCVNECEGGNEDKRLHEENFYKGGKVSWWNFYYSEQPGSMPFIKRDKFDYIVDTIIPDILNRKTACEFFNIFHLPGCGGTTLAMHVLWTLKDKFRCAVLKDTTDDYSTVAEQVVQLLTYETEEQATRLPILLMIDDFQDCEVKKLQDQIKESLKQKHFSKSLQVVIIVSCVRDESFEPAEKPDDTVFIGNVLSVKEKKQIEEKLKEIEVTYENAKEFHGIKNLHANFSSKYIQGVVKKSLRGFDFQHKHAQLFAVLVLLHVYSNNASLSVSMCEEFLGLQTKADSESCKVEDRFEMFSTLLTRCIIASKVTFEGMRVNHSSIAQHCLEELSTSHGVTKAEITNLLLTTESFYGYTLGKQKLMQDVLNMLVRRQYSAEVEDFFSPLIQDIMKETPGTVESVLKNAANLYRKDAVICQLLARYYIKKEDFTTAMSWAKKAKDLSRDNSDICDTVSQVHLHKLKHAFEKDRDDPVEPDSLDKYLTLAGSASEACKETQQTAEKEVMAPMERQNDYNTDNTAGNLSELQTADTVIQILKKTPFNTDFTSNNHLTQVLLGKITIEDLLREKPELKKYCDVLQKHTCFLLQLKDTVKQHFVFLKKKKKVNLVPFFVEKDKQKELTMRKVSGYIQQYTELFCKINPSELINNVRMNRTVKIEQTHQCLERNKGDSYDNFLDLYVKDPVSALEEIIQQYKLILKSQEARLMDFVIFSYANVILTKIKPTSLFIMPYQDLRELLLNIIKRPTPNTEILPLHFLTVLSSWLETHHESPTFVSQIKMPKMLK